MLAEPVELIRRAVRFSSNPPERVPLIGRVFTSDSAELFLAESSHR
jgi:hypothetical protein